MSEFEPLVPWDYTTTPRFTLIDFLFGCQAVFDELERLRLYDPVELAFLEMQAKGDLLDLPTLEVR